MSQSSRSNWVIMIHASKALLCPGCADRGPQGTEDLLNAEDVRVRIQSLKIDLLNREFGIVRQIRRTAHQSNQRQNLRLA